MTGNGVKTPLAIGAICLVAFGSQAAASEMPGGEGAGIEEVQVTATRQARSVREVTGGVTVLGKGQLERATPQVLPEALKGQTGAWVQQTTPGQAAVFVRGLKGSEVLHLVDGMRLNNAFFRNAPSQYLALVDSQAMARVEVLRGPASALYGSDAMGGVVQVLSALPRFDSDDWRWRGQFRAQFSSAHDATLGRAGFEIGNSRLGVGGGVTYQDVGDREGGDGRTLAPSAWRAKAANLNILAVPHPDHELLFSLQYLQQPRSPRYDELVAGFGQTEPASEVFSFEPNDRLFLHGRYTFEAPLRFVDRLEAHVALQDINDDRRTRDTGSSAERRERNRSRLSALTLQAESSPGRNHELVYGMEVYADEISSRRTSTDIDTGISEAITSRFPDGSTADSIAVYLTDQWSPYERLRMHFGARYSRFDTTLPEADRGVGARIRTSDLTGDMGLNVSLTPDVNLVLNAGRGFRPPNIFDLGTLGARPGNRFNIANTDLAPESVITADVGLKWRHERHGGELFLWRSRYRDKIVSAPTGDTTADGRQVVRSANLNELRLRGLEAAYRYAGERAELYWTFTTTWGEERFPDGSAVAADRIPPANGRLGLVWRPAEALRVEPFLAFARRQGRLSERDVGDPRINPDGTPGWVTANLRLAWEIAPDWRIDLKLLNLGDISYRPHGSGIDAAGFDAVLSLQADLGTG